MSETWETLMVVGIFRGYLKSNNQQPIMSNMYKYIYKHNWTHGIRKEIMLSSKSRTLYKAYSFESLLRGEYYGAEEKGMKKKCFPSPCWCISWEGSLLGWFIWKSRTTHSAEWEQRWNLFEVPHVKNLHLMPVPVPERHLQDRAPWFIGVTPMDAFPLWFIVEIIKYFSGKV